MIRSVTITNYVGDSIKLELTRPEKSGFIVKSIDGLGPVKANINTTQMSTVDGTRYNSAILGQRNIVFHLDFLESKKETIEDIRLKSYKYFPIKKKVSLLIETDARLVETEGYVESNEPDIFSNNESCTISVICPDPNFYSKEITNTVFSGVEPTFEFPFSNESTTEPLLKFGDIKIRSEEVVVYKGDAEVGVTISIYALGDARNITIYNLTTREQMTINTDILTSLTGSGIITGDTIIIRTKTGNKSAILIRDGITTNILNCLDKGSDWFKLVKGDNVFAYIAASGGENLHFRIENQNVFEGV